MILVGLLLVIGISFGCMWVERKYAPFDVDLNFLGQIVGVLGGVAAIVLIGASLFYISEGKFVDDRIEMYQEQNTQIEKDIESVVVNYMEYEQDTFDMSEVTSPTILVQMYPELKSDTLVQEQIGIYVSNNDKIKELKNKEIDVRLWKWLLYFGGN